MSTHDLVTAFGLATRLRACEVDSILDVDAQEMAPVRTGSA